MEFRTDVDCQLVSFQHRKETARDGGLMEWWTLDFIRLDGEGVIQTTIGARALNGADLKKGGKYRVGFRPKAIMQGNRAVVSSKPQITEIAPL